MLKDITLGQYFPGDTVVHRLDPRTKLLMVIVYIVALFLAKWVVSYAVMLAFLVTAVALSRIRPRALFKGLKPLLFIIIFTAIINVFYTKGDVLVQFWIFKITREGLVNAGFLVLRIVMLVTGTFLLTYTTSPIALTDGLESLLSPLKAIHFPVHELALMMSIALRFIPTLIEETDKIISAQKARGADFETGNLFHRANALVPIAQPDSPCFGMLQRLLHTVKGNIIIAASVHFNKRTLHLFPPYLAAWCCLRVQVIAPQYVSRYLGARFTLIHRLLFDESVGLALRHIFTLDQ